MKGLASPTEFDRLIVVLVSTRNPLNIGAAARAISNLGFSKLRVVNPYEASFREARSAVGAEPLLKRAEEFESVADAIADCPLVVGTTSGRNRELHQPLIMLPEAAPRIRKTLRSGRVALLFGSEKRGLSNSDLSYCHWLLRIPTRAEHGSMNLGQAVAVCLYEFACAIDGKQPRVPPPADTIGGRPASVGELDRITTTLLDVLRASGYLEPLTPAAKEEKIRRMVRRLGLSRDDAKVWLGMLRQILWKFERQK